MVSPGLLVVAVIGGLLAFVGFGFLMFSLFYVVLFPRFKPGWSRAVSGRLIRFAFRRLPGYGLTAHQNSGGQYHLRDFDVEDGEIYIDGEPYMTVDEVTMGSVYGLPFIVTYSGFAGLVNAGLAKVGEEIRRQSYEDRAGGDTAVADGGATDAKGQAIDIPERAVVDTAKIKYTDTNASVPAKAARAVKNAKAQAREDMDLTPQKMALYAIMFFGMGAGVVLLGFLILGNAGGMSANMALVLMGGRLGRRLKPGESG